MSEAAIFKKLRNLLIPYFILFGIITFLFVTYFKSFNKEYAIFISFLGIFASLYLIKSWFGSAKFKGVDRTYVLGPDLGILREEDIVVKQSIEEGDCFACGRKIFKPFRCDDCKNYYCGEHYLKGEHKCIDD